MTEILFGVEGYFMLRIEVTFVQGTEKHTSGRWIAYKNLFSPKFVTKTYKQTPCIKKLVALLNNFDPCPVLTFSVDSRPAHYSSRSISKELPAGSASYFFRDIILASEGSSLLKN